MAGSMEIMENVFLKRDSCWGLMLELELELAPADPAPDSWIDEEDMLEDSSSSSKIDELVIIIMQNLQK